LIIVIYVLRDETRFTRIESRTTWSTHFRIPIIVILSNFFVMAHLPQLLVGIRIIVTTPIIVDFPLQQARQFIQN